MLFDAGLNLTSSQFANQEADVLQRARDAGVMQHLLICSEQAEFAALQQLAQQHQQVCTAGVHPHNAKSVTDTHALYDWLLAQSKHQHVVALGECGLDYNRDFSPRPTQNEVFACHIASAKETNLPLYLHERDAFADQLAHLKGQDIQGVAHCFTGNKQALFAYLDLGLYIGITGWVCDERRGKELAELVPHIPLDRLLLETDAPYLLPRTLKPKPKSRVNEPQYLPHICEFVAARLNITSQELAVRTTENAQTLFGHQVTNQ